MSPDLECRIQAIFESIQTQQDLLATALAESAQSRYLVGSSVSRRLCERKIRDDIVRVDVDVTRQKLAVSVMKEVSSLSDRVGTIGQWIFNGHKHI